MGQHCDKDFWYKFPEPGWFLAEKRWVGPLQGRVIGVSPARVWGNDAKDLTSEHWGYLGACAGVTFLSIRCPRGLGWSKKMESRWRASRWLDLRSHSFHGKSVESSAMQSQNPSFIKNMDQKSTNLPKYPNKKLHKTPSNSKQILAHIKYLCLHIKVSDLPTFFGPRLPCLTSESHGIFGRPRTRGVSGAPSQPSIFSLFEAFDSLRWRCGRPRFHWKVSLVEKKTHLPFGNLRLEDTTQLFEGWRCPKSLMGENFRIMIYQNLATSNQISFEAPKLLDGCRSSLLIFVNLHLSFLLFQSWALYIALSVPPAPLFNGLFWFLQQKRRQLYTCYTFGICCQFGGLHATYHILQESETSIFHLV